MVMLHIVLTPKDRDVSAHLIRKARRFADPCGIAITGAINQKAAQIGQWILDDLRALITKIADLGENEIPKVGKLKARLTRVCHLGKKVEHTKLQALAKEILNDWDAVVAFVKNPELPQPIMKRNGLYAMRLLPEILVLALAPAKEVWLTVLC